MKEHSLKKCTGATVLYESPKDLDRFWEDASSIIGYDPERSEATFVDLDRGTFVGMQMPMPSCRVVIRPEDSSCLVVVVDANPDSESFGTPDSVVLWAKNAIVVPPRHLYGFMLTKRLPRPGRVMVAALDGSLSSDGVVAIDLGGSIDGCVVEGFDVRCSRSVLMGPKDKVRMVKFERESVKAALGGEP